MSVPIPPEIASYELWMWSVIARMHDYFCMKLKQPQESFIKVMTLYLELAAKEEAKAATGGAT